MKTTIFILCALFSSSLAFQPRQVVAEMNTIMATIILTDTTWPLANSPYELTDDVQIAYGATLTIEPGVIINGNGYAIQTWGTLNAVGTEPSKIIFNNVDIMPGTGDGDENYEVNIQHSVINSGKILYPTGSGGYGSLSLKDSVITDIPYIYLRYPHADCYIERNVFSKAGGIYTATSSASVYIRNNLFYQQIGAAVLNYASYWASTTTVEYNSFLSTDKVALILPNGYTSANMTATNNYWNTEDTNVINSMIYDKNDDLRSANYIDYLPILTSPHPDTPVKINNDLIADLSDPSGIYVNANNTDTWTRITTTSPGVGGMAVGDLDGSGKDDVIGDWNGIWAYMNDSSWTRITTSRPGAGGMVTGDLDRNGMDDLIVDLGSTGTWAYMNNSSWTQITSASPGVGGMVTGDLDGNGKADLIGDWNGTWVYMNNSSWTQITSASPGVGGMVTGDLDGNGQTDLIGDWNGTWIYMNNSSWKRITKDSPGSTGMVTGDLDGNGKADMVGVYNGTWIYMNDSSWKRITSDNPGAGGLAVGDLDGNGKDDVIGDWNGIWAYMNDSSWTRVTTSRPGSGGMFTGNLDWN